MEPWACRRAEIPGHRGASGIFADLEEEGGVWEVSHVGGGRRVGPRILLPLPATAMALL